MVLALKARAFLGDDDDDDEEGEIHPAIGHR